MSNTYSPEAQQAINTSENKLSDAIASLKSQQNVSNEPSVEVIKEAANDVEVIIDTPDTPKKPGRSEFVKTDDPKVIERINDLYGQVKKSDARNQMLIEHNRLMEEKFAEYQDKLNKFEQTTKNTASDKVESELKAALRIAREEQDFQQAESIEDKLLDLRLERRLADKLPPQDKQSPRPAPQPNPGDEQFINNAKYIEFLASEKDSQGNPVRPYLYNWHPDNQKAVELFTNIPSEFAAAGKQVDMKTIMEVVDERIRGKRSSAPTSVLGAESSNDSPARSTVRLTQAEINVARNMGISPERYAKQKQLINS